MTKSMFGFVISAKANDLIMHSLALALLISLVWL